MNAPTIVLCVGLLFAGLRGQDPQAGDAAPQVFREDFREVPAHTPATAADLSCAFLGFEATGPGAERIKLSFHPDTPNDPHYLWNGDCPGAVLLAFPFAAPLDLSARDSAVEVRSKNVGGAALHVALRCGDAWFVQEAVVPQQDDWGDTTMALHASRWRRLDPEQPALDGARATPRWRRVHGLGFVAPERGGSSGRCVRLDAFALRSSSAQRDPDARIVREVPYERAGAAPPRRAPQQFYEVDAPVVRSAVLAGWDGAPNRTRRGVLVRCGSGVWACFDPDLLRWSAIWRTPALDSQPITLDGMAAISYPDKKAKAGREPRIVGDLLVRTHERPGGRAGGDWPVDDPRTAKVASGDPVGPLPRAFGHYQGVTVHGHVPTVRYRLGDVSVHEVVAAPKPDLIRRTVAIAASEQTLRLQVSAEPADVDGATATLRSAPLATVHVRGDGARLVSDAAGGTWLEVAAGAARTLQVDYADGFAPPGPPAKLPVAGGAAFPRGTAATVASPADGEHQGPMLVRELALPAGVDGAGLDAVERAVRPTDLAFLADGTALVTTFDGDVWRVDDIERARAKWRRVAAGLFEPLNIEVDADDRVYVLGRDQVTELCDDDGDGVYDRYENCADGFWQTLHTRDYAMSMELEPDGSFLIAKGGIDQSGQRFNENGAHRGTVLRVRRDGSADVLADGLRMPYVGRRHDGAVFLSDQQGNWVPSTPVYLLQGERPGYGFLPTRHRGGGAIVEPMLYFPYQSNRSGAGFVELDARAFPALADRFVHVAWDGRLFVLVTPDADDDDEAMPFGWRLPLQFAFPSLNGDNHPRTGTLYAIGLGISGYQPMTQRFEGLAAVRQDRELLAPTRLVIEPRRVVVTFAAPVPAATDVRCANLRFWNIRRSRDYGSGHYRWDGRPGEHTIAPSALSWSDDRRTLQLAIPAAFRASIAALHLQVTPSGGAQDYALELFGMPTHLPEPDATQLAAPDGGAAPQLEPGDAKLGEQLFTRYACVGCHSLSGQNLVGPPLDGIARRTGEGKEGEAFLRQSILEPQKVVAKGYPAAMPSFEGVIPPQDVEHLVAFLGTLR